MRLYLQMELFKRFGEEDREGHNFFSISAEHVVLRDTYHYKCRLFVGLILQCTHSFWHFDIIRLHVSQ